MINYVPDLRSNASQINCSLRHDDFFIYHHPEISALNHDAPQRNHESNKNKKSVDMIPRWGTTTTRKKNIEKQEVTHSMKKKIF